MHEMWDDRQQLKLRLFLFYALLTTLARGSTAEIRDLSTAGEAPTVRHCAECEGFPPSSRQSFFSQPETWAIGATNNVSCVTDTGVTCWIENCGAGLGAAECLSRECMCRTGYCLYQQMCRGCENISIQIEGVPEQSDKAGVYSAVAELFFDKRPIWKQYTGRNWLWYCRRMSCWVVSPFSPNPDSCDAGIVSPQNMTSVTPFDTFPDFTRSQPKNKQLEQIGQIEQTAEQIENDGDDDYTTVEATGRSPTGGQIWWSYWDGNHWIPDANSTHIRLSCADVTALPR